MADSSLNTSEVDKLIRELARGLQPRQFALVIDQIAREIGVMGEARFPEYPERPARIYYVNGRQRVRKKYKRTGTLGRSLNSRVVRVRNIWRVTWGSNVIYSVWVLGDPNPPAGVKGQAWMHKGIWTPLRQAVLNEPAVQAYIGHTVKRLTGAISAFLRK